MFCLINIALSIGFVLSNYAMSRSTVAAIPNFLTAIYFCIAMFLCPKNEPPFHKFCTHNTLKLVRAHPLSPIGKEYGHLSVWKDRLGCFNILQCTKCHKYISCVLEDERVYDSENVSICVRCGKLFFIHQISKYALHGTPENVDQKSNIDHIPC
jgi:hypothetical protein